MKENLLDKYRPPDYFKKIEKPSLLFKKFGVIENNKDEDKDEDKDKYKKNSIGETFSSERACEYLLPEIRGYRYKITSSEIKAMVEKIIPQEILGMDFYNEDARKYFGKVIYYLIYIAVANIYRIEIPSEMKKVPSEMKIDEYIEYFTSLKYFLKKVCDTKVISSFYEKSNNETIELEKQKIAVLLSIDAFRRHI